MNTNRTFLYYVIPMKLTLAQFSNSRNKQQHLSVWLMMCQNDMLQHSIKSQSGPLGTCLTDTRRLLGWPYGHGTNDRRPICLKWENTAILLCVYSTVYIHMHWCVCDIAALCTVGFCNRCLDTFCPCPPSLILCSDTLGLQTTVSANRKASSQQCLPRWYL